MMPSSTEWMRVSERRTAGLYQRGNHSGRPSSEMTSIWSIRL